MNRDASCHEIPDCPGLFIDAFRSPWLQKTCDPANAFVLTHYHGDHYGNLPKQNRYRGPALIHCTKITARLLRDVHLVPKSLVVEHAYGEPWTLDPDTHSAASSLRRLCFYDAHHCPGAAILYIETTQGKVHLHTGDMRYDPRMIQEPLLQEAVQARTIDTVWLDTTYGHPKYDFMPQQEAINLIASQVQEILSDDSSTCASMTSQSNKVLILLSCYNIGKEKVLWEVSQQAKLPIYINEKKQKLLQAIDDGGSSSCIKCCTQDPKATPLHVIPMGLAGEMWPYFRANYFGCAAYARKLNQGYGRVVAFLPTGWADASNWNKKNAITSHDCDGIHVTIHLVPYSEHSAFTELLDFVKHLKPRRVVPTVYKDEADARKIAARFPVDTKRAKEHFFAGMMSSQPHRFPLSSSSSLPSPTLKASRNTKRKTPDLSRPTYEPMTKSGVSNEQLSSLLGMGFSEMASHDALSRHNGDLAAAVEYLLSQSAKLSSPSSSTVNSSSSCSTVNVASQESSGSVRKKSKLPVSSSKTISIKSFFSTKKD